MVRRMLLCLLPFVLCSAGEPAALSIVVDGSRPNPLVFAPCTAKSVQVRILATSSDTQACLDELEIYGSAGTANLARQEGAKVSASSCLEGHPQHQISHLNDGLYGNGQSWIAASNGEEWVQVDFAEPVAVNRVVFSRDREGKYLDRIPTHLVIRVSPDGTAWQTVCEVRARVTATPRPASFRGIVGSPPPAPRPAR